MIAVGDHIVRCNPVGQRVVAANWQRDLNSATSYSERGYRFWLQTWNELSQTVAPAHLDLIGRKLLAPQHKGLATNPGDKPLASSRGDKTAIELFLAGIRALTLQSSINDVLKLITACSLPGVNFVGRRQV